MSVVRANRVDVPRLHLRERSNSPVRSASKCPTRRVPSPLLHAQFRPVAMDYAGSPTNPQSCKYFNQNYKEEEDSIGAPGGYCAAVRTVGYSTVGDKTFMSGKCPHCKRPVKSTNQVCTPNSTPPTSPWNVKLRSPLRSPFRSSKNPGGHATLQSPLRSPFKGSFFGPKGADDEESVDQSTTTTANLSNKPTKSPCEPSVATLPKGRITRAHSRGTSTASKGPRGRSVGVSASTKTPWRGRALTARSTSPVRTVSTLTRGPRSPGPGSPMHSPWKGEAFFEGPDAIVTNESCHSTVSVAKSRGAHSPGPRSPLRVKVDVETLEEEDERREAEERHEASKQRNENTWKSPLRSPFKGGLFTRGNKSSEAETPAPAQSE